MPYLWPSLVTMLTLVFYFFLGLEVSRARVKYGVRLPHTTGDANFERVNRIHLNMLEQLPIFLPALWLFAFYIDDVVAAFFGLVWLVARILYRYGYRASVARRLPGFILQTLSSAILVLGALGAIIWHLVALIF